MDELISSSVLTKQNSTSHRHSLVYLLGDSADLVTVVVVVIFYFQTPVLTLPGGASHFKSSRPKAGRNEAFQKKPPFHTHRTPNRIKSSTKRRENQTCRKSWHSGLRKIVNKMNFSKQTTGNEFSHPVQMCVMEELIALSVLTKQNSTHKKLTSSYFGENYDCYRVLASSVFKC